MTAVPTVTPTLAAGQKPASITISVQDAQAHAPVSADWLALAGSAVEPNIFHHPLLLVPLSKHLGRVEVTDIRADGEMAGAVPLRPARLGFGLAGRLPSVIAHDLGPLGTPLLAQASRDAAIRAFLAHMATRAPALILPDMPLTGIVMARLLALATEAGHRLRILSSAPRAVLNTGLDAETFFATHTDRKRRKEWARQKRRLAEQGTLVHEIARDRAAVTTAFQAFIRLEGAGWKGRSGTALQFRPALAATFSGIIGSLADHGQVEIDRLTLDGETIAALVTLRHGDTAWTWKTAYDETLSSLSPGVLLMVEVTRRLLETPGLRLVDSLAVPDHPMINHIWPDRMEVATVLVDFRRGSLRPWLAATDFAAHTALKARLRHVRDRLRRR